ncbi:FAD/NAD(P)-binding domain-containing protein [Hypoxylon cercidicola]|nr:FAD/NAD(P)-binding domain-containing protein [Hypoxylon cercidicola]
MASPTRNDNPCYDVIIIGGSLAGLMCGLAAKHAGHNVQIIEQSSNARQSHRAGIGLAPYVNAFLEHHDRLVSGFTHQTTNLKALKGNGALQVLSSQKRGLTSWDAFYYRLRSLCDGYISPYYPTAPSSAETDGSVTYKSRNQVLEITRLREQDSSLSVDVLNLDTGKTSKLRADYVIGADGPDSLIRAKYLPDVQRQYAGYVVWRGIVPEGEVSDPTRELFSHSIVVHILKQERTHCVVYMIPGVNGSLQPGERLLNFILYTNETPETLDDILVDAIDGHRHHNTVPAGQVKDEIWSRRVERAKLDALPAPFLEVIDKVKQPFVQVIGDFCSPRAAFEDGKVLLIGDALALFRPHAAAGSAQAAFHSLAVADYLNGKITAQQWEEKVLKFSFLHWQQSIWWGDWYQKNVVIALISGLRFWTYIGIERVKSWWNNAESPI